MVLHVFLKVWRTLEVSFVTETDFVLMEKNIYVEYGGQ